MVTKAIEASGNSKALFATLAFAVVGLILVLIGVYFYYNDTATLRDWKLVKGEVTKSQIKSPLMQGGSLAYTADIDYNYAYQGKKYYSKPYTYGSSDYDRWKTIVDNNPVGSHANVLVDPASPENSVLKDSIQPMNWLNTALIIAGVIGIITGLFATYMVMKTP